MSRLRLAAIGLLCTVLCGCGFQLRGPVELPFSALHVQGADATPFGSELRRTLRASNTRLVDQPKGADATLQVLSELNEKHILSLGGGGRVREFQLRYRVAYRVTDPQGREIAAPTEILLRRDLTFNDTEALAKEAEEQVLFRDMRSDAVQQLLRRLQVMRASAS